MNTLSITSNKTLSYDADASFQAFAIVEKLISFTGHTETGVDISTRAAKTLKRVSLELGGKNPIVIWDDADLDLALDSVIWSAFGTSGQRCTAASRIVVHRSVHDDFVQKLQKRAAGLILGDGLLETTDVGPVINDRAVERIDGYVKIGQGEAEMVTGGKPAERHPGAVDAKPPRFLGVIVSLAVIAGTAYAILQYDPDAFTPRSADAYEHRANAATDLARGEQEDERGEYD